MGPLIFRGDLVPGLRIPNQSFFLSFEAGRSIVIFAPVKWDIKPRDRVRWEFENEKGEAEVIRVRRLKKMDENNIEIGKCEVEIRKCKCELP